MPELTIYTENDHPGSAEVPPFIVGDSTSWAIRFEKPDGTAYVPSGVSVRVGHINGLPDGTYVSAFTWHDRCGNSHIASITVASGVPALTWSTPPTGGFIGENGVHIIRGQIPDGKIIDFQANTKILTLRTNEILKELKTNVKFTTGGSTGAAVASGIVNWEASNYDVKFTVVSAGSGYSQAPIVQFNGGEGTGMQATATVNEFGGINSIKLTNLGYGYKYAPQVALIPVGGSGSGAVIACELLTFNGGAVQSALVSNAGAGYTHQPTITLSDENTGSGAEIVAEGYDTVSQVKITNYGSGYTSNPTITVDNPGGFSGDTAVITSTSNVVVLVLFTGIGTPSGNWSRSWDETILFTNGGGTGAAIIVSFYSKPDYNNNGNWFTAVNNVKILNPGTGYTSQPTVTRNGFTFTGKISPIITITNPGSGYSSAPTLTVSGGGGTGMALEAVIGRITNLKIANGGSGYSLPPKLTITNGGGTGALGRLTTSDVNTFYRIAYTEITNSNKASATSIYPYGDITIINAYGNERIESISSYIGKINAGVEVNAVPYKRAESSTAIAGAVRLSSFTDGRYNSDGQLQYDHSALLIMPRTIASANFTTGTDSNGSPAAVGTLNPVNAHVTSRLAMRRTTTLDLQVYGDGRMLFQGTLSIVQKIT